MTTEAEKTPDPEPTEERPLWLSRQFASPEDLARSYKESQAKITTQGQQLSEALQENERLQAELEALFQERDGVSRRLAILERLFLASGARA